MTALIPLVIVCKLRGHHRQDRFAFYQCPPGKETCEDCGLQRPRELWSANFSDLHTVGNEVWWNA